MIIEFIGIILFWHGPAPYYFITVPEMESLDLKAISGFVTYGWGVIPVCARIGETEWKTSLFPKDGRYLVPIRASVRRIEDLDLGDEVSLGHPQEALAFVGSVLASAKEHGLTFRILELTIVNALVYEALGRPSAALDELQKALDIDEIYGFTRVIAEIPHLEPLLQQAIAPKIHPKFAKRLLASLKPVSVWKKSSGCPKVKSHRY